MNIEHYNLNSREARDQEHHDFVRHSGLPLHYFRQQNRDKWGDRIVLAVVVLGAIAAFVGVRWYGW